MDIKTPDEAVEYSHENVFFLKQDRCQPLDGSYRFDHGPFIICEQTRTLECKSCKKLVDPIDAFIAWSRIECRWLSRIEELRNQMVKTERTLKEKRRCKCEFCGKMTDIGKAPKNLHPIRGPDGRL